MSDRLLEILGVGAFVLVFVAFLLAGARPDLWLRRRLRAGRRGGVVDFTGAKKP